MCNDVDQNILDTIVIHEIQNSNINLKKLLIRLIK